MHQHFQASHIPSPYFRQFSWLLSFPCSGRYHPWESFKQFISPISSSLAILLQYNMFFTAEIELALRIISFRNISVKQPCELSVRLSIYHQDQYEGKVFATPFSIVKAEYTPKLLANLNESSFDLATNSYVSRRFKIRYQEQTMDVNEICLFKTSVDAFSDKDFKSTRFYVFAELCATNLLDTVTVSKIECETKGMMCSGFVPIYFDDFKYCTCMDAQMYATLIKFKFQDNRESIKDIIENRRSIEKVNHIIAYKELKLPIQFGEFSEFLSYATDSYKKQSIQKFYDKYINLLRKQITTLKGLIKDYIEKLSPQDNLSLMGVIQKLCAPFPTPHHYTKKDKKRIFDIEVNDTTVSRSSFQLRISELNLSPATFEECFITDFRAYGAVVYELWRQFMHLMSIYDSRSFNQKLRRKYIKDSKKLFEKNNLQIKGQIPNTKKQQISLDSQNDLCVPIEEVDDYSAKFVGDANYYKIGKTSHKPHRHLIVFVHGFQAYSMDMDCLGNYVKYLFPACDIFFSTCNEGKTDSNLQQQGQRFALELKNYLNQHSSLENLKISFFCHSMGGLIVRAAFPYLTFFKHNFYYFISLSSPHLGYLLHSSALIRTSLWFINKMNDCTSMKQICFEDSNEIENSYLMELSKVKGLQWFKGMVLYGSKQDDYVSIHSARMQPPQENVHDPKIKYVQAMIHNILGSIKPDKIARLEVKFDLKEKDFNSIIGRTAHIQILSDKPTIRMLVCYLMDVFM